MKQNKSIKPFDTLLMAYVTNEGSTSIVPSGSEKEAEIVLSKEFTAVLKPEKVALLLSTLEQSLSKDTLGSLVQKTLTVNTISVEEIQNNTGLTASLLEDIKADMIFTNSIPVKSLVKLFKLLSIPLLKAQAAIDATFEKLNAESKTFLTMPASAQPVFRKGVSTGNSFDLTRLKSDESYLYQNKEALDKYTKRLGELYAEL